MTEITYLIFYLLVIRILTANPNKCPFEQIESWLRSYKHDQLLAGNSTKVASEFDLTGNRISNAKKTSSSSGDTDAFITHLTDQFKLSSYLGKSSINSINTILERIQKSRKYRDSISSIYLNMVTRISMVVVLATAGRILIKTIFRGSSSGLFDEKSDRLILFVSILFVLIFFLLAKLKMPRPWFSASPFSKEAKCWLQVLLFSSPIQHSTLGIVWREVEKKERYSGLNHSREKQLILSDWEYQMDNKKEKISTIVQNYMPIVEILGGSIVSAMILVFPLLAVI